MTMTGRLVAPWLLLGILLLTGCARPEIYKQQSYVFGTLVELSIWGEPEARAAAAATAVLADFDGLHRRLHAWEPGPLDDINTAIAGGTDTIAVPSDLGALIADAQGYAERSGDLFNPAIGNLVRLWGFHSDSFAPRLPARAEIERLIAVAPRMSDLRIEGERLHSSNPAVRLDLGGYAKGHALDLAAARLRAAGIGNALVNIGGNILALGRHGERPWRVGIQHPRLAGAIATLELGDGEAIGTSGDYQRYFEVDGKRYCHLIDPRNGWPVQGVQAVTVVVGGEAAGTRSDVFSKPLFIAGAAEWPALAKILGVGMAMRIDADGGVHVTQALAGRLRWEGDAPTRQILP